MGPKGLEPPNIWAPWLMQYMSPQYSAGTVYVNDINFDSVSQKRPTFTICYNFTYTVRLRQFLAQMLPRKQAIKMYFIFPPHLACASALPGEQETRKLHLFT